MSQPRFSPELDHLLAECLEEVLRGRKTVAECLEAYPDYAADLKPALQVALLTARLKSPGMAAEKVSALEARLRAQMPPAAPALPRRMSQPPSRISRLAAMIAIVVFLAFGSGAGLVTASADSLPGDALYGVKRLWEAIVLALSPLTGPPGELWLQVAERRLNEVTRLAAQGRLTQEALIDLYVTAYNVTRYGADAARVAAYFNRAYVTLFEVNPPPNSQLIYLDLLEALGAADAQNGSVTLWSSNLPPSLLTRPAPPPLITATLTFTPTLTPTLTLTTTWTPTLTRTPTLTPTPTPRIPPTPTRTPTLIPPSTLTPTPTRTPTATWTPLPLPGGLPTNSGPVATLPPGVIPTLPPVVLPTLDATQRLRETQQAVYLTQTAGPPSATPNAP